MTVLQIIFARIIFCPLVSEFVTWGRRDAVGGLGTQCASTPKVGFLPPADWRTAGIHTPGI